MACMVNGLSASSKLLFENNHEIDLGNLKACGLQFFFFLFKLPN